MSVLGLSAGNPNGSAEILLKEALRGVEAAGGKVELVRLQELDLSSGPDASADDSEWFWNRLMESDGLVVSTPIYARTIPGLLRLLGDKISGPQADVAFTSEILRMRRAGEPLAMDFAVDERVLRPRVAGFIAVGGSLPTRWKSLALPLLHTLTASAQIAVVDQVEFAGAGSPASIVLDLDALARARRLGDAVGSQLGRAYDDAEYRGEPGACPMCHLSVLTISGTSVECATCGAGGSLLVRDGAVSIEFTAESLQQSILSYGEKLEHFHEVQQTASRHARRRAEIDATAARLADWDPSVGPDR